MSAGLPPPETALEAAARAAAADPEDTGARLRLHERLLAAELHVLLEAEVEGASLRPRVFDLETGPVVVVFDTGARLAAFLEEPSPYAALSGRRLVAALAGTGLGIALDPGTEGAETLLGPESVDWLAAVAAGEPERAEARLRGLAPPRGAPQGLAAALDGRIAAMADRIAVAWLAEAVGEDGATRLVLAVEGAPGPAQEAIAAAFAEAARLADAALDVTFLGPGAPARAAFERAGLRFDPPPPPEPPSPPSAPGADPDRPPILRRR